MKKVFRILGPVLLALLVYGCDFGTGGGLSFPELTGLSVDGVPEDKASGENWDIDASSPDVYFILYTVNGTELISGINEVYTDPDTNEFPLAWTIDRAEFRDLEAQYYVELWDSDVDADDFIGRSPLFRFEDSYLAELLILGIQTGCNVMLSLEWTR